MTTLSTTPLRQRMVEDMTARKRSTSTQNGHIRACKRFAAFLKRSPDTATSEDIRRFQLHLSETGMPTHEFIRRFLMHVLPKGFHRIRHYGFLANGNRAANVARARHLLAPPSHHQAPDPESPEKPDEPSPPAYPCPSCGGPMVIIETFEPGQQPQQQRSRDPPACQGTRP